MRHQYFQTVSLLAMVLSILSPFAVQAETITLTLTEAVERALKNNLNLKLREQDVLQAKGEKEAARGEFDTLFTTEAGTKTQEFTPLYSSDIEKSTSTYWNASLLKRFTPGTEIDLHWNNGTQEISPANYFFDPAYTSKLVLAISQPLLKGFGQEVQTATIKATEKQEEATSYLVDNEAAALVAEVKKAYWELVYAWQDIEVQKLSLQLAIKLLEEIREKIQAGKLAEVEIFRPESEVARREENLITSERAIGFAEDNLKLLINSKDWTTSYTPKDLPPKSPVHPKLSEILSNALTQRPDLKAADLLTESAQFSEKKAKNNLLPALAVIGSIGAGGTDDSYPDSVNSSFEDPDTLWSVGVNFSLPLHNSQAKGEHRQAKAIARKAQTNAELLRQQVRRTVRTTVRDVNLAIKAMDASHKTTIATQKGLEAEEVKFKAGRATTLDILVAQETYSQALSQEKRTQINYAQALADLDRIQGLIIIPGKM